jgi:hypothetical protein
MAKTYDSDPFYDQNKRNLLVAIVGGVGVVTLGACAKPAAPNTGGEGGGGPIPNVDPGQSKSLELKSIPSQIVGNTQRIAALAVILNAPTSTVETMTRQAASTQPQPNSCYEQRTQTGGYALSWYTGGEGNPGMTVTVDKDTQNGERKILAQIAVDKGKPAPSQLIRLWGRGTPDHAAYQHTISGLIVIYSGDNVMTVMGGNLSHTKEGGNPFVPIQDQTAPTGPTFSNLEAFARTLVADNN